MIIASHKCLPLLGIVTLSAGLLIPQSSSLAEEPADGADSPQPAIVDVEGFLGVSRAAAEYRRERLVTADEFLKLAHADETLILDTRSQSAYDSLHLAGAVHLNFSDITDEKLAKVIPTKETRILIYCNNNFQGRPQNFPTKRPALALNVPTFVNLYASGYRNIYELSELIAVEDDRFEFAGTDAE